jgi:hypothetical protein
VKFWLITSSQLLYPQKYALYCPLCGFVESTSSYPPTEDSCHAPEPFSNPPSWISELDGPGGVDVGSGVFVTVGLGDGVDVSVAVGLGDGVDVSVAVGLGEGVDVGLGTGVGVGGGGFTPPAMSCAIL